MPSHFTLRMQFGPHQDAEEITRQLLKLVRTAPVDEIMFFFFGEEMNNGHETIEEVKEWIERSRPYRKAVADAGIKVSLNPYHSLLHRSGERQLKPGQNWQPMVDQNGLEAGAVVCPLDKGWRAYFEETLRLYAKEGFRVIWIDDDFRYHNHRPLDWGGCFCPLHVAEFNRRTGANATREKIVASCTASGEPHPWREIWLDMWQETALELVEKWRRIVEAGGSRLGLMSSRPEPHAAEGRRWEQWWKAFGGAKPPVHRPHIWEYRDMLGVALPDCIAQFDQNRRLQPAQVETGAEIENYPYGSWIKSFRQTGASMALAHILGSTNLNISLYDFMGNMPDDDTSRIDFLRRWRPVCDWLADEFPMSLRSVGIGIPWSEDMGRRLHTDGSGKWQSLTCPSRGWANWLGATGYAFAMAPSPSVNALGGPVVWSFSDAELQQWLSKGVLLDGVAAHILTERRMEDLIGARRARLVSQKDIFYSVEHCLDAGFSLRASAEMPINDRPYSLRILQADLAAGAKVISDIRGPKDNVVGHGAWLFENKLGGRVAVVPWIADARVMMNVQRAAQLRKILAWLARGERLGSVEGGPWLVPQFLSDGKTARGVIWNASPDEASEIAVSLPKGMDALASAIQVNSQGDRLKARWAENRIRLAQPLYQWDFVALI